MLFYKVQQFMLGKEAVLAVTVLSLSQLVCSINEALVKHPPSCRGEVPTQPSHLPRTFQNPINIQEFTPAEPMREESVAVFWLNSMCLISACFFALSVLLSQEVTIKMQFVMDVASRDFAQMRIPSLWLLQIHPIN